MNVGVVTQARMASTRLPGKVLLPLGDRPALELHLERLAVSEHDVIVATTSKPEDDRVVELAEGLGVPTFRGSEHDVLSRFVGTASAYELDLIVRVTSDCPLVDGHLVAAAVRHWRSLRDPMAYVSNTLTRTYPRGLDLEVFGVLALLRADERAVALHEREHVTPYLYNGGDSDIRCHSITRCRDGAERFRLTLDTPEDYRLLGLLVREHEAAALWCEDLIEVMRAHPEMAAINSKVEQKKLGQ